MKTMILSLLLAIPLFSQASYSYEDYRLAIYSDYRNLITVEFPSSKAKYLFFRLVQENNGKGQVSKPTDDSTTYRVQSKLHPLLSCRLFEYHRYNGSISRNFHCELEVNVSWSAYRSALPTDSQDIKDYTFDYEHNKLFQWKGSPAKALFEQLIVDKYHTEKSEIIGATTTITRTVSDLGCAMKSDSGDQEYFCWIEN